MNNSKNIFETLRSITRLACAYFPQLATHHTIQSCFKCAACKKRLDSNFVEHEEDVCRISILLSSLLLTGPDARFVALLASPFNFDERF